MKGQGLLQVGLGCGREIWICLSSLWISSSGDSKVSVGPMLRVLFIFLQTQTVAV